MSLNRKQWGRTNSSYKQWETIKTLQVVGGKELGLWLEAFIIKNIKDNILKLQLYFYFLRKKIVWESAKYNWNKQHIFHMSILYIYKQSLHSPLKRNINIQSLHLSILNVE